MERWVGRLEYRRKFVELDARLADPENHILFKVLCYVATSGANLAQLVCGFLAREISASAFINLVSPEFPLSTAFQRLIRGFHYSPLPLRAPLNNGGEISALEALPIEILELIVEYLPPRQKIKMVRHICRSLRFALEGGSTIALDVANHTIEGATNWAILSAMYSSFKVQSFGAVRPVPDFMIKNVVSEHLTVCHLISATQYQVDALQTAKNLATVILTCDNSVQEARLPNSVTEFFYAGGDAPVYAKGLKDLVITEVDTDAAVETINGADELRALSFEACRDTEYLISSMRNRTVRDLRIGEMVWHAHFTVTCAVELQTFKYLTVLYLSRQSITAAAMQQLAKTSLKALVIKSAWFPDMNTIEHLTELKTLESLTMHTCTIKKDTLLSLIKELPRLAHIDVHDSPCLENYVGAVAHCIGVYGKAITTAVLSTYEDTELLFIMSELWDGPRSKTRSFVVCDGGNSWTLPNAMAKWRAPEHI
jgi:hypothetical protein